MWEIAVVCSMWQIIRHANQAEAAVESLIMVRVPHKGTSPPHTDPPGAPPDSGSPPTLSPSFTSTPILLLPLYPQTDRWTRGRGWSSGRRGEFGEAWAVWLVVAPGVFWLCVDLLVVGGGVAVYFWIPLKCQSEDHCCFTLVKSWHFWYLLSLQHIVFCKA